MTVDDLANEIRRVDGSNSLGAGALAEALMPFLEAHYRNSPVTSGYMQVRAPVKPDTSFRDYNQPMKGKDQ